jgi:hypothetical protein
MSGRAVIEAVPIIVASCPPRPINTSFVLCYIHILDFFTFSLSSPLFPHNNHGSQARNQALTHLCEHIFVFFKQCIYAALFSAFIFTTTGLLAEEVILGIAIPNVRGRQAL